MIGGIKATLIICLTVLVSCVLFISYNEYANRYSLIATNDNHLYIFDKKSTVLNRCGEKGCELIETKLPSKVSFGLEQTLSPSKMFESDKPMRDEIVKTEATPEKNTIPDQPSAKEPKTDEHKSDEKKTSEKSDTDKKDDKKKETSSDDKKNKKSSEDEFIE